MISHTNRAWRNAFNLEFPVLSTKWHFDRDAISPNGWREMRARYDGFTYTVFIAPFDRTARFRIDDMILVARPYVDPTEFAQHARAALRKHVSELEFRVHRLDQILCSR